eukprot:767517-Alexandrium_andersonii.AAC.1
MRPSVRHLGLAAPCLMAGICPTKLAFLQGPRCPQRPAWRTWTPKWPRVRGACLTAHQVLERRLPTQRFQQRC